MRLAKKVPLAIIASCSVSQSVLALEFEQMEIAMGLAQVIAYAEPCGYKMDQAGLETYFEKVGLSNPEGLSYVTANVPRQAKEPPTEAGCTMARSTAKSIGVLSY